MNKPPTSGMMPFTTLFLEERDPTLLALRLVFFFFFFFSLSLLVNGKVFSSLEGVNESSIHLSMTAQISAMINLM